MRKLTNIEFIKKAEIIHVNVYDYKLINYTGNKNPIKIICKKHGIFEQRPNDHLNGSGCFECANNKNRKLKYLNNNEFINKAKVRHNNIYDYSLIDYINSQTKVKIICKKHGVFEQRPNNHLNGQRCPNCYPSKKRKNIINFIEDGHRIHQFKYNYNLVHYINSKTKVKITCKKHGVFEQTPNAHLIGQGCPTCNESKGELKISEILNDLGVEYIREKKFNNCKNINKLSFDFYLPKHNLIIEYDGIQHFKPKEYFGGVNGFNQIKKNDEIKNNYCLTNNIKLLRIGYWENIGITLKKSLAV